MHNSTEESSPAYESYPLSHRGGVSEESQSYPLRAQTILPAGRLQTPEFLIPSQTKLPTGTPEYFNPSPLAPIALDFSLSQSQTNASASAEDAKRRSASAEDAKRRSSLSPSCQKRARNLSPVPPQEAGGAKNAGVQVTAYANSWATKPAVTVRGAGTGAGTCETGAGRGDGSPDLSEVATQTPLRDTHGESLWFVSASDHTGLAAVPPLAVAAGPLPYTPFASGRYSLHKRNSAGLYSESPLF
jgi:hypothetical protein